MRIALNLATRPYADLRPAVKRLRILMVALVVLAGALGLGLHTLQKKADQARAREHRLDSQIASVRAEEQGYQKLMQQPDNAQLLTEIAKLNQFIDEKSFSWTLAIEDLETVLPGGVQVSTLEPVRSKEGQITLHLRVAGPRDLDLNLVKNLEHSRRFLLPRIVGETADSGEGFGQQRLQPVSASNRVDFDLLAEYNPPAPGEYKAAKNKEADEADADRNDAGQGADQTSASETGARGAVHPHVRQPYIGATRGTRRPAAHIARPNPWPESGGPQ